jgi:hypothetical protein
MVGTSGRRIDSVFSSKHFDGSFTKTHRWCQTNVGFTFGETICFRSLEFIAGRFGSLSISPEGNDSYTIFVGMVHSGSSSLHTILEESTDVCGTSSSGGGRSSFPIYRGCNMVTPTVPITTILLLEGTPAPLTIPMVLL